MGVLALLILFPLIIALIMLAIKSDKIRTPIVVGAAIVIGALSIFFAVTNLGSEMKVMWLSAGAAEIVGNAMIVIEAALALLIVYQGLKYKKYLACILALVQTPLLIWFELTKGHDIKTETFLYSDNFSIIMIVIIGVIGSAICVYATGYMKDFTKHHPDAGDRRPFFYFLMFLFLSAMFGIVISNNLVWMYFFWEITTLCSFFLIGYSKGLKEAINNSFRALIMNLLGGLFFVVGIVVLGYFAETVELSSLLTMATEGKATGQMMPFIPVVVGCLAFAGLTKAAQMPFSSWLLGAMVAPTPTSALLHSSTMVKAGVFLIVKLSPALGVNTMFDIGPGFMVILVGGVTFLFASMAALSQSNAKRVLAYSTVANLGLIVACAGVGTAPAVWAAILLIIFHAVTKSLLFLCVGTAEHNIRSRDIEDMDGLFGRMPRLAAFMIVGISGMFLAPFGMLISKWAALQAVADSNDAWLVLFIVFGSSVTLFYWMKWLGKMVAVVANRENIQQNVHNAEWSITGGLTGLVIAFTITFPFFSHTTIVPYLTGAFKGISEANAEALRTDNLIIMIVMVVLVLCLILLLYGRTNKRVVPLYMSGVNKGDDLTYEGAMQKDVPIALRNWYLADMFPEKLMNKIGNIVTCVVLTLTLTYLLGIVLYMLDYLKSMGGVL
ncbi:MAG: NADH-quinone oxidoreductase subunit L [Clostridiales Family XIII bacterium]|nr:NADH-quinone oxidoreductase subunit L [Clostridiales Family XIII bacterium]